MKISFFLFLFLYNLYAFSQTASGDLEAYLNLSISNIPENSGDDYRVPANTELTSWENCIQTLLNNDLTTARTHADMINYQIVAYTHTANNNMYYIVEEKVPQTNYWGTYVFAQNPATNALIIQAPHSSFDFNTGKQAIYSFVRLNNAALFLNGAHRCNHSTASTCSGTTSVCSSTSEAYKISDMAHNSDTVWQKTTALMNNAHSVFVQLHGFSKQPSDPYVILSNGTDQTPATDYAVMIKDALFNQDNSLTFKIAHIDNWTRLVGFTNTQGRLLNESTNPCTTSAASTTGKFIHIEQEKSKLRENASGWEKLFQALHSVFIASLSTDSINKVVMLSENPFKKTIRFSGNNIKNITLYNILGSNYYKANNDNNQSEFLIDTSNYPNGIYILKMLSESGIVYKKLVRN